MRLRDALELAPTPRVHELDVGRAGRVVRQLVGVVRPEAQLVLGDAEVEVPAEALAAPSTRTTSALSSGGTKNSISICSNSRVRKMKLPGVISLRNDLPICAMPNGGFLRVVVCTFLKLTKMPCAVSGRRYATDASSSTGPTCVLNIRLKLRASVKRVLGAAVRARARLGQLVGAEALLAVAAVDERVGERGDVTARLPDLRRHEDRGVEADDVVAQLHHRAPPGVLDVALEQHAERPVVPGGAESAVDLGRREHQAAPLREVDDAIHQLRVGGPGHSRPGYSAGPCAASGALV